MKKRKALKEFFTPPAKKVKIETDKPTWNDFEEIFPDFKCIKQGHIPKILTDTMKNFLIQKTHRWDSKNQHLVQKTYELIDKMEIFEKEENEFTASQKHENVLKMHQTIAKDTPILFEKTLNHEWKDLFGIIFLYIDHLDDLMDCRQICKYAYQTIHSESFLPQFVKLFIDTFDTNDRLRFEPNYQGQDCSYLKVYLSGYASVYQKLFISKKLKQFHEEKCNLLNHVHQVWDTLFLHQEYTIPLISEYFGKYFQLVIHYPLSKKTTSKQAIQKLDSIQWKNFKHVKFVICWNSCHFKNRPALKEIIEQYFRNLSNVQIKEK